MTNFLGGLVNLPLDFKIDNITIKKYYTSNFIKDTYFGINEKQNKYIISIFNDEKYFKTEMDFYKTFKNDNVNFIKPQKSGSFIYEGFIYFYIAFAKIKIIKNLKDLTTKEKVKILGTIINKLMLLETKRYIHTSIKLENIIVREEDKNAFLINFESSEKFNERTQFTYSDDVLDTIMVLLKLIYSNSSFLNDDKIKLMNDRELFLYIKSELKLLSDSNSLIFFECIEYLQNHKKIKPDFNFILTSLEKIT